jgi:hypothetical protein
VGTSAISVVKSKSSDYGYQVYYQNGVFLGDIFIKEDGFYDFWPEHPSRGGCWPAYVLRAIADKLDELNKPWEDIIHNDPALNDPYAD